MTITPENTATIVRNMRADGENSRADYLEKLQLSLDDQLAAQKAIVWSNERIGAECDAIMRNHDGGLPSEVKPLMRKMRDDHLIAHLELAVGRMKDLEENIKLQKQLITMTDKMTSLLAWSKPLYHFLDTADIAGDIDGNSIATWMQKAPEEVKQ